MSIQSNPGGRDAGMLIRNHADILRHAPAHPETFTTEELPGDPRGALRALCNSGLIEKVGFTNYEDRPEHYNDRREYRLEEDVAEAVEEFIANREVICPCGHSGVSNCGDYYECHFDPCDKEFQRDELEVE